MGESPRTGGIHVSRLVVWRQTISIRFLVLLGPPGSGKSSLGRILARDLGYDYRDREQELLQEFGSVEAFVADKPGALKRLEAGLHARAGDSSVPIIVESTGISDRDMLLRLPAEETVFIALCVPESVCLARVSQRKEGGNFSNDPEKTRQLHRIWVRDVEPSHSFDLKLNNHEIPDEEMIGQISETVARRSGS